MLTPAQLLIIKSEITADPRGYGYATMGDGDLAAALNKIRDGSTGTVPTTPTAVGGLASGIITVRRNDISGAEILQAVDPALDGQTTLTNLQTAFFNACATMRQLSFVNSDGTDNAILKNLKQCFTAGTSRTNLTTISKRTGSRAEELMIAGTIVDFMDIPAARQS
jgi:hypothetical protein